MGYVPNTNCIHCWRAKCTHPKGRTLTGRIDCIMGPLSNGMASGCRYQVKIERPPAPKPGRRPEPPPSRLESESATTKRPPTVEYVGGDRGKYARDIGAHCSGDRAFRQLVRFSVMLIAAFCFLAVATDAAGSERLHLGGWSGHRYDTTTNASHEMIALEVSGWSGGTFVNSYDDRTVFAAKTVRGRHGPFDVGAMLGVNYGYRSCMSSEQSGSKTVCPQAGLVASISDWRASPALMVMPGVAMVFFEVRL